MNQPQNTLLKQGHSLANAFCLVCSGGVVPAAPAAAPAAALPNLSKWTILSALYELSLKSSDGSVHLQTLVQHYPTVMNDVIKRQHGNMLYALTRPMTTLPALVKLVDRKGSYRLTEAGSKEALKLVKQKEAENNGIR